VGVRVGVAYSRKKLALSTRNLNLKYKFSIFNSVRNIRVHINDFFKFAGVKVGVTNFVWVN